MTSLKSTYHQSELDIASDMQLVEAAKKDIAAFEALYDKYYIDIFRFIHNRLDDEMLSADVCSQVFYKAMKHIAKYKNKGLPYASYLYRIARNELISEAKKQKKELIISAQTMDLASVAEEADLPPNYQKELVRLLESLKASELELIEMKYFEKRSYREMSEILDVKEELLKVKVFRIVKKLRKHAKTIH
jgi:RNA polymerase sigma-70 factor (ECF subfamily)